MSNKISQQRLKLIAATCVALYFGDRFIVEPALEGWKQQSEAMATLEEKVQRGRQTLNRQAAIERRWSAMLRANLPQDVSEAESLAYKAMQRWKTESNVSLTSSTQQWQSHEEGFDTLEFRVSATGNQTTLGRFLYEIESDPLPVTIEECELSTRDPRGAQLTLTARLTFLRLNETASNLKKGEQ